jgi:hypothetical protein
MRATLAPGYVGFYLISTASYSGERRAGELSLRMARSNRVTVYLEP